MTKVKYPPHAHHFLIEPEPENPDVLMLSGACKLCGAKKQWKRKFELSAQDLTFRGYRRNPHIDHSND